MSIFNLLNITPYHIYDLYFAPVPYCIWVSRIKLSSHSVFPNQYSGSQESCLNSVPFLGVVRILIIPCYPRYNPPSPLLRTNTADPVVFTLTPPECFMEIRSGYGLGGNRIAGPVHVGDPITLLVYMRWGLLSNYCRLLWSWFKFQIPVGWIWHPCQWLLRAQRGQQKDTAHRSPWVFNFLKSL